jgi:uncharacterized protein (DUF1697 family)
VPSVTYVAFVRAVMIGREGLHREVLLDMFERGGAPGAVSYLSTGNVSFAAEPGSVDSVVDRVESDLEQLLGRPTPLFVRSLADVAALVDADPFATAPFDDVYARLVTFFRTAVPGSLALPMVAPNGDWEVFASGRGEVFSVTRAWPDRQPSDPGGVIQRLAGQPATTRALGTIERIVAKLGP